MMQRMAYTTKSVRFSPPPLPLRALAPPPPHPLQAPAPGPLQAPRPPHLPPQVPPPPRLLASRPSTAAISSSPAREPERTTAWLPRPAGRASSSPQP
eukprot:9396967-Heterocapsa_arctica.AAC.1